MSRILSVLLLVLSTSCLAYAQSAIAARTANLYGTPDTYGAVVQVVETGDALEIIKQKGEWHLVQSSKFVGWIRSSALRLPTTPIEVTATIAVDPEPPRIVSRPETRTLSTAIENKEAKPEEEATASTALCKDGSFSYIKDKEKACKEQGGIWVWLGADDRWKELERKDVVTPTPASSAPSTSSGGTVQVRGYYRKDGTYVAPHTRSAPRRKP